MAEYMEIICNSLEDSKVLGLNYYNLRTTKMKIDSLYNELEEYENNLHNNVIVSINSICGGDSPNLSQAEDYVRNKIALLQKQKAAAAEISLRIYNLHEIAIETDEFVEYAFEQFEERLYETHPNLRTEHDLIINFLVFIDSRRKKFGDWVKSTFDRLWKSICSLVEGVVHLIDGEFLEALSCFGSAVGYIIDVLLSAPIGLLKEGMKCIANIIPENLRDTIKKWYYFGGGREFTRLLASRAKLIVEVIALTGSLLLLSSITGGGALIAVASIKALSDVTSGAISFADAGVDYLYEEKAYQQYKEGDYIGSAVSSDVNSCSDYLRKTNFHDGKANKLSYQNADILDTTKTVSSLISIFTGAYLKHHGVGSFGVSKNYETDTMKALGKVKGFFSDAGDYIDVIGDTAGSYYGEELNEFTESITKIGIEHTLDAIWEKNSDKHKKIMRYTYDDEMKLVPYGEQLTLFEEYDKNYWKLHLVEKVPSFIEKTGETAGDISDIRKGIDSFSMTGLTPAVK